MDFDLRLPDGWIGPAAIQIAFPPGMPLAKPTVHAVVLDGTTHCAQPARCTCVYTQHAPGVLCAEWWAASSSCVPLTVARAQTACSSSRST